MMSGLKPLLWSRMELRLTEMKERRKRLIKYMFKKEGRLSDFEKGMQTILNKKA